jgi:hypothetical protein
MNLHSPSEDLEHTLTAISGTLRKLEYLSGLRNRSGGYTHWGMAKVHGDQAASSVLSHAHRSVVSRVLSMPLRELLEDAKRCSELAGLLPEVYLENLAARGSYLLPPDPGAGSQRHLNSALRALSELARYQTTASSLPAASQPQPPARSLPPLGDSAGHGQPLARADAAAK